MTSIGQSAFEGCSNLTCVVIPEGVQSIRTFTFRDCTNLGNIIIPESVKSIANDNIKEIRQYHYQLLSTLLNH